MREILLFATISALLGTVFLVSLLELILTIRRRKISEGLRQKVKELRATYNESVNKLVLDDDAKLAAIEEKLNTATATLTEEKANLEKSYQEKIDGITAKSEKALKQAQLKAKKLSEEAKEKADEYSKERRKEVEDELMNLVISVSKKVLPDGISYEAQKELVMQALNDVKTEDNSSK